MLEQIYYIGELVGVAAIIASLLYVGRQFRQNNTAMRNSASTEFANGLNALTVAMVMNREFAEVWAKGEQQFQELDAVDKQRLLLFEFVGMSSWRRSLELHQQGLLPDQEWQQQLRGIELLSKRQSVRAAWERFSVAFDPYFHELVKDCLP